MDKVSIPNLSVLFILMFAMRERVRFWPDSRIALVLVTGLIFGAIPTVITNNDPILFEVLRDADPIIFLVDALPGQSIRDIGSVLIGQILTIVPFLLARQFLASEEGLRELLLALMVGALIYSIPSLIEIRLSPQINVWVYGYFQHSFEQMMRAGGFRPIVFLPHGLWLAVFIVAGLMSAAALARAAPSEAQPKMYVAVLYLFVLLVLCKSAASLLYGLAMTPLILFFPHRFLVRVAVLFAVVAVTYPMLRNFQLIPLDAILAQAESFSAQRAQSLEYRFDNEEQLLSRAAEKPLFGWGGWGRSLIRDPETGEILTIPDGRWIIIFGTFGWLGYICEFGLLALSPILIWVYIQRHPRAELSPYVAPLCLILTITMMDMLLNDTLTPFIWLIAGAILGHAERLMPRDTGVQRQDVVPAEPDAPGPRKPGKRTVL
ncbi:MAG: hypothetical protein AAF509_13475 [Pseudomonadota bacterium]